MLINAQNLAKDVYQKNIMNMETAFTLYQSLMEPDQVKNCFESVTLLEFIHKYFTTTILSLPTPDSQSWKPEILESTTQSG